MSNVTVIYDQIISKLGTLFPTRTRIPNPYSLVDNNDRLLKFGYGLKVGSASFSEFEFCSRVSQRTFSVVFTYEMYRTDSDFFQFDDVSKKLLEDVNTIQGLFFNYNELDIEQNILKVDIDSVSEVEMVLGSGNTKYLSMEASFLFQIKEDI